MPVSKAHIRANVRYEAKNYDKVLLRLRKDTEPTRETIQKAADAAGMSLNAYIIKAVTDLMSKEEKENMFFSK